MIKSILLILFYCSLSVAYHGTPVVWDRIPQFKVNDRVTSFLNKQQPPTHIFRHHLSR